MKARHGGRPWLRVAPLKPTASFRLSTAAASPARRYFAFRTFITRKVESFTRE